VTKLRRGVPLLQMNVGISLLGRVLLSALILGGATVTPIAYGLPTQGVVSAGTASVTAEGPQLSVRQVTPSVVIDWKTFGVGDGETVRFIQPNVMSTAVNRVASGDPSLIAGQIIANGRIVLINSSGILFSSTSRVDVGGLIASTLSLVNGDLSGGALVLEGDTPAAVINRGRINIQDGGILAFVGTQVKNFGEINAPNGQIAFLAGNRIRLETGGLLAFEIGQGVIEAMIEQGGIVRATGGRILLAAQTFSEMVKSVINMSGITEGGIVRIEDGAVVIDAAIPIGAAISLRMAMNMLLRVPLSAQMSHSPPQMPAETHEQTQQPASAQGPVDSQPASQTPPQAAGRAPVESELERSEREPANKAVLARRSESDPKLERSEREPNLERSEREPRIERSEREPANKAVLARRSESDSVPGPGPEPKLVRSQRESVNRPGIGAPATHAATHSSSGAHLEPPLPVEPTPDSPIAAEKLPTPRDSADSGDKLLATVASPESPKTADRVRPSGIRTALISAGLIELQTPVAPRVPGGAVAGQRVSMMGAFFGRW